VLRFRNSTWNKHRGSKKKRSEETQTLRAGCSKAEPQIFAPPPQTPFPEARDGHQATHDYRCNRPTRWSPGIDSGTVTACPACGGTSRARPQATWPHQFCSARTTLAANQWTSRVEAVFSRPQGITWTVARLHHRLTPASRCHFIPVLTAGRQSRRLCRVTNEPENGGSSIFHCCTASVEHQLPTQVKRTQSTFAFRWGLKTFLLITHDIIIIIIIIIIITFLSRLRSWLQRRMYSALDLTVWVCAIQKKTYVNVNVKAYIWSICYAGRLSERHYTSSLQGLAIIVLDWKSCVWIFGLSLMDKLLAFVLFKQRWFRSAAVYFCARLSLDGHAKRSLTSTYLKFINKFAYR